MVEDVLSAINLTKEFPGVIAVNDVSFTLQKGEIHALVGANGAGKSTLIKLLAGVYPPDKGSIQLFGQSVKLKNPNDARKMGISVIYQEFTLFPELDIARNIYFGVEPLIGKSTFIDWPKVYSSAKDICTRFGFEIDVWTKVKNLSIAQQQMVEIIKAVKCNSRILIMDEPTAALTTKEVDQLFTIISELKKENTSIIYISHRLNEVMQISDRITVLRNGKKYGEVQTKDVSTKDLVMMMVGEEQNVNIYKNAILETNPAFEVKNISNKWVHNVNFYLRKGEILGIAGLVGAGRTELARAIFGADPKESGQIFIDGREAIITQPKRAIELGIGYLPENRKTQGLFLNLNIKRNIIFAALERFRKFIFIDGDKENSEAIRLRDEMKIKTPSIEFAVNNLSGGNQQKVVFAKWLCAKSKILILDEPTRGIDIGAKEEIFNAINNLSQKGISIIFISSELEEVLRISNRILTMYKGEITGEFNQKDLSMKRMMSYITGVQSDYYPDSTSNKFCHHFHPGGVMVVVERA